MLGASIRDVKSFLKSRLRSEHSEGQTSGPDCRALTIDCILSYTYAIFIKLFLQYVSKYLTVSLFQHCAALVPLQVPPSSPFT